MGQGKGLFFIRVSGRRCIALLIAATLLAGCTPAALREVSKEVTPGVSVEQVASEPTPFIGKKVMWGGIIVFSENLANKTTLDIVEVPLTSIRRPGNPDGSRGRFIVEHEGFLDTAIYSKGREITIAGEITGVRKGKIGEMEYTFPVLKSIKLYLWQPREDEYYSSEIYLHLPFYYPYHYGPYPSRLHQPQGEPPNNTSPRTDPPRRDPPPGHDYDNGRGGNNNRGRRR